MKKILFLLLPLLFLTSCTQKVDPLEYQNSNYSLRAKICFDELNFAANIESETNGTSRTSKLTLCGGVLDGVSFEYGENNYICKDDIKIPTQIDLEELFSLFYIDDDDIFSENDGEYVYVNSNTGRKYMLYTENNLPKRIIYECGYRQIICEIDEISFEEKN